MRRFVLGWKKLGLERQLGSRIVTYADDLVIPCKYGKAEGALQQMRMIIEKLSHFAVAYARLAGLDLG